jgi:flavin reductase (DIM6/NTAB) family NADH-FMN oxidoreductase RutF
VTEHAADIAQRHNDLRRAFSMFPSGVTGVCALVDGTPVGMAASSFTSVSLQPPLVSVCIDRKSTTWPLLARAARLGVSVLSSEHAELARALSARDRDRFAGAGWHTNDDGALFLLGATLWLDCAVSEAITAGDHFIVLLEVLETRLFPDLSPLIFHRSELRALDSAAQADKEKHDCP